MSETVSVELAKKRIKDILDEQLEAVCHDITESLYKAYYDEVKASINYGRSEGYFQARMYFTLSNYIDGYAAFEMLNICKQLLDIKIRRKYDDDVSLLKVLENYGKEYDLKLDDCDELYFKLFRGKFMTKTGHKLFNKIRNVLDRFGHKEIKIKFRPFETGLDVTFFAYGNYSAN